MPAFRPTVVCGVSSEGLAGPLVVSQLVGQLDLDQVCALEAPFFPAVSMVYFRKPKFPARIYVSTRYRLAVVLAEFAPDPDIARPIAEAILRWCAAHGARRIISIEGYQAAAAGAQDAPVSGVGSLDASRSALAHAGVPPLEQGVVTGVTGVLLNEGRWRRLDVVALLGPAGTDVLDLRTGAQVLAHLARLVPGLGLRPTGLEEEAARIEALLRSARERVHPEFA